MTAGEKFANSIGDQSQTHSQQIQVILDRKILAREIDAAIAGAVHGKKIEIESAIRHGNGFAHTLEAIADFVLRDCVPLEDINASRVTGDANVTAQYHNEPKRESVADHIAALNVTLKTLHEVYRWCARESDRSVMSKIETVSNEIVRLSSETKKVQS